MLRFVTGISIRIFIALGVAVSGGAQTANFAPEFEKVSIKTVTVAEPCLALHGEFNQDDTIIDYRGVRLAEVIEKAYGLDIDIATGPTSIWTQLYDIKASIGPDTPVNEVPAMLRRLLVERFDLKLHTVAAEHEEYWLVVADGGLKMRQARPPQGKGKKDCSLSIAPKAGVGVRIVAKGYMIGASFFRLSYY